MSGLARIAAFAALLAVLFAGAALVGGAVDPDTAAEPAEEMAGGHGEEGGEEATAEGALPGLAVADDGLRLQVDRTRFTADTAQLLRFRIVDTQGRPVRAFETEQGRRMHLIVVRRDLRRFQHLHPRQARDGTWSVSLTLPEAGTYRAFADFQVGGEKRTLGQDLFAAGTFTPLALPAAADTAQVDGYTVGLIGTPDGELAFRVSRGGRPVTDLEDYLGAKGHLVALRDGDLAYLHTHPEERSLRFGVEYPSAGRYRLFVQFKHRGAVRTAAFTQEVTP